MASGPTIKIRRSAVKDKVPSVGDLSLGELAINTYDGRIFLKSSQTVGQTTTESIITLEKQLTAGTGVTITSGAINIGQNVSTTATPTFAGATLNGITAIKESGTGAQNTLTVAGAGTGSLFAVGVSNTATDGIKLQSLTSDLANPAKLTISGSPIILKAGTKEITFNDTGNLELPGNIKLPAGGDIVDSENNSVLKFPVVKRVTFDNLFIDNNFCYVFTIDGSTNKITTGGLLTRHDQKNFEVDGIVTFFGRKGHTEEGVANIVPYQSYYIKTLEVAATAADLGLDQPDPFTDEPAQYQSSDPILYNLTISLTKGGTTFDLLDFQADDEENAVVLSTVSPNSYQTQRAPRHFQNFDEQGNNITGEMINATFGDTYYDNVAQHIFIFTNQANDGTPQLTDITVLQ